MHKVLLLIVFFTNAACLGQPLSEHAAQYQRWGAETLHAIQRDLWLSEQKLYAEQIDKPDQERRQPAFMWGCGVQLSALIAAARIDPHQYQSRLLDYAEQLQRYWHVTQKESGQTIAGYDVQPHQRDSDRYYDDNAWIVLAQVELYQLTHDRKYLARAIEIQRFVMTGEDQQLGGGLYWRENERQSKNTCSNAPGMVGALLLYQLTQDDQQLADAQRLYAWTCEKLQDPADGLFWDALRLDGKLDRRKFTYNSAVMIRANALLYDITGDDKYRQEAVRIAQAAIKHWIDPESGAIRDAGHFAHMLLEALLDVGRLTDDDAYRILVARSLNYVHDELRDADGRYPNRWYATQKHRRRPRFQLLDQASVARAFFVAADSFRTERNTPAATKPAPQRD